MVRRTEVIELFGFNYEEVIGEFQKDVDTRKKNGWECHSYAIMDADGGIAVKYIMERWFPYNQNAV